MLNKALMIFYSRELFLQKATYHTRNFAQVLYQLQDYGKIQTRLFPGLSLHWRHLPSCVSFQGILFVVARFLSSRFSFDFISVYFLVVSWAKVPILNTDYSNNTITFFIKICIERRTVTSHK